MNFSTGTRVVRITDGTLGNVVSVDGDSVTCRGLEGGDFVCDKGELKTMRGRPRKMVTAVVEPETPACDVPAEACGTECETPCCDAE